MPYSVSGVTEKNYHGTGVIVDAQRGLVVIDRNTVPVAMGDVRITFNGTVEVPGKVEFIHPLHNLAVVSYDPRSIGDTPVRAATLLTKELRPGDDVWVVGQRSDSKIMSQHTQVASVDVVSFPLSRTLRFRDSNLEAISLVNAPADLDGVLANEKGEVLALWSSFAFETQRELEQVNRGIPADLVTEMIQRRRRSSGRCIPSRRNSTCSRSRARANWACPTTGCGASRSTIRSAGRCSASIGWLPVRPRRRCSSRAICCSPSTARS